MKYPAYKMTYHCCCCNKIRGVDGKYYRVPYDEIPGTLASHGYCPECIERVFHKPKMVSHAGIC